MSYLENDERLEQLPRGGQLDLPKSLESGTSGWAAAALRLGVSSEAIQILNDLFGSPASNNKKPANS